METEARLVLADRAGLLLPVDRAFLSIRSHVRLLPGVQCPANQVLVRLLVTPRAAVTVCLTLHEQGRSVRDRAQQRAHYGDGLA